MENEHKGPINHLDEKKKKSMMSRILVAVVLGVTCIPALIVGSWFWFAIITFFLVFAVYEILHCRGKKFPWYVWAFTYFIVMVYVYWFLVKNNLSEYLALKSAGKAGDWTWELERWYAEPTLSIYAIITAMGVYLLFSLINKDFDFGDVCYFLFMTIMVGFGFQCLLYVRYHPFYVWYGTPGQNPTAVFKYWHSLIPMTFVILTAFGNDVMAYFTGMFFGKHKMTPRVSPNKTWEGFFGGWLLSGSLALGFALICDANGFPLLPEFAVFSAPYKWWAVVILSYGLPLIAVLGDLSYSLIKRHYGFKDYGTLLRSHGGVLDRVDSLTFCCILCSVLIVIVEKGWGFFL